MPRVGAGERAELRHALCRVAVGQPRAREVVACLGQELVLGIFLREGLQHGHGFVRVLRLDEGAGELDGGRGRRRVIGKFLDETPEVGRRRVAPLELEVGEAQGVEGVGEERRGRLGRDDAGIGRARVGEALHPVERLRLPEARLLGLAGNGREPFRLPERIERGVERSLGEPGSAHEQHGIARPPVAREALEEALEHAAGQRVEAVLVGLLADQQEAIGLVERLRGPREGGGDRERREEQAGVRAEVVRHTDTVRLPRPP